MSAFVAVISMCLLYVSLGSRVSPSIFGLMFMGSVMLSIYSARCVLYSAGSGVSFTGTDVGVSDVLNSVGDKTPPFGTPVLNWRCVDVLCLNVVCGLCHLM